MNCCGNLFQINFYIFAIAVVMLLIGMVIGTARKYLGKEMAYFWTLSLLTSVIWYQLMMPSIETFKPSGLPSQLIRVANWAIGPCTLISTIAIIALSAYGGDLRETVAFVILVTLMYIGVRFICSSLRQASVPGSPIVVQHYHPAEAVVAKENQLMIEFGGNIAAGKTTRGRAWRSKLKDSFQFVDENVHTVLHDAFIDDPKRYAFTLQMAMRERRNAMLCRTDYERSVVGLDRSAIGDYVFAIWNYISGAITEEEFGIYREAYGSDPFESVQLMIPEKTDYAFMFVCTPARTCQHRVQERQQNDKDTTPRYMTGIAIVYYMCVLSFLKHNQASTRFSVHLVNGTAARVTDLKTLIANMRKRTDTVERSVRDLYEAATVSSLIEHERVGTSITLTKDESFAYKKVCEMLDIDSLFDKGAAISEDTWHSELLEAFDAAPVSISQGKKKNK